MKRGLEMQGSCPEQLNDTFSGITEPEKVPYRFSFNDKAPADLALVAKQSHMPLLPPTDLENPTKGGGKPMKKKKKKTKHFHFYK